MKSQIPRMKYRTFIWSFLLSLVLMACAPQKAQFHAIDITGANYAQDFSLPDAQGNIRTLKDFAGKVVVVFFGFTQCPDVCPSTLAEISAVKQALNQNKAGDGDRVQTVFISIDPQRDTPDVLKAYVESFDSSFIALRPASSEALAVLAQAFKVYYKKVPSRTTAADSDLNYTMDHTAASYVFDPQGRVRLFTRYGSGAKNLQEDIQLLLRGA